MKYLRFANLVALWAAGSALTGCTLRVADLSIVSTRNISLDHRDLDQLPQKKGIRGVDSKWIVLIVPIGTPHLEDAIDDALDTGEGDVMIDAVIHRRQWWFLVGQDAIEVKGTVVKTR